MRGVFTLLLSVACAQAFAAGLPPCERAVRFSAAWFADPELDHSKSAADLGSVEPAPAGRDTQLGHVVVETQLAVVPQTACAGVTVRLEYVKPVLRVASDIPAGTCAYARVMNHEQTHVRIHREIAQQFRELHYPWPHQATAAAVLAYARQELDRLMQAQVRFDSPEEYARNLTVCNGELTRLVKPLGQPQAAQPAAKPN